MRCHHCCSVFGRGSSTVNVDPRGSLFSIHISSPYLPTSTRTSESPLLPASLPRESGKCSLCSSETPGPLSAIINRTVSTLVSTATRIYGSSVSSCSTAFSSKSSTTDRNPTPAVTGARSGRSTVTEVLYAFSIRVATSTVIAARSTRSRSPVRVLTTGLVASIRASASSVFSAMIERLSNLVRRLSNQNRSD